MGVNGFGLLGSMRGAFSVGATVSAGADVVVGAVVSGALSSSPEQPAVKAPMVMTAPTPTTAASCLGQRFSSVMR
ncbi:hypothetical protein ABQE93_00730 [Mycolicibacterium sp. XJ662]